MTFVVTWDAEITKDVDAAIAAADMDYAGQIAEAVEQLDDSLRQNALALGESRESGLVRVLTKLPLTIHFRITDRLHRVRVFALSIYRKR
ncbi:MAG: hypothetical protein AAGJ46_06045 [Planctomycetota bacterium]